MPAQRELNRERQFRGRANTHTHYTRVRSLGAKERRSKAATRTKCARLLRGLPKGRPASPGGTGPTQTLQTRRSEVGSREQEARASKSCLLP